MWTKTLDDQRHAFFSLNYWDYKVLAIGTRSAFFSMKAAELKCQNLIVKKVCQVEHRKAIDPELGL